MKSRNDQEAQGTDIKKHEIINYSNIMMSLELGLLKGASAIPTQPLQVIMRRQQARMGSAMNPALLNASQACKELWNLKDSAGKPAGKVETFFKGWRPGAVKEFGKSAIYKGYLIVGAPVIVKNALGDKLDGVFTPGQYHLTVCVMAGVLAGVGDTVCGGIPEALGTFRSTSHGELANAKFLEGMEVKSPLKAIAQLYRGFIPASLKGAFAFSTFYYTAAPIKARVNQYFGVDAHHPEPWTAKLTSAVISGFTVALISAPLDNVKTQKQMPGATKKSVMETLADNVKKHGPRSLVIGLPIKTLMVAMGWGIAHFVTQRDRGDKKESISPSLRRV